MAVPAAHCDECDRTSEAVVCGTISVGWVGLEPTTNALKGRGDTREELGCCYFCCSFLHVAASSRLLFVRFRKVFYPIPKILSGDIISRLAPPFRGAFD